MDSFSQEDLAQAFAAHRTALLALVRRQLNPVLLARLSHEDVLAGAYESAARRLDYFASRTDVPVYFKLRTILLQHLTALERQHLQAKSRDAYRDMPLDDEAFQVAAEAPSPASCLDRDERHRLLRAALASLGENDRRILVLRHFDGFGNSECAAILGIDEKAASIRHVRALERLEKKLVEISCFRQT